MRHSSAAAALLALLAHLLVWSTPAAAEPAPPALRVMTFNVRLPLAQDGANSWEHRRAIAIRSIARTMPDIIGTQELFQRQGADIVRALPGYGWFGIDRRGGHADEHMGIFYRRDRLALIELGNFWLSDTPDVPGSISWGNLYPRMVTWGLFEMRNGGKRLYVFNTHFPYREQEDEEARGKMARLLVERIGALPNDIPVVLTGDFNTAPDGPVHALLSATLSDARLTAKTVEGPENSFHNFTGAADQRIDWIFSRGFEAAAVRTLTDHRKGVYASDHFPIIADLGWR